MFSCDRARLNCYTGPNECDGSNITEVLVSINLGSCCDINRDGTVNGLDVAPFTQCVLGGGICP